MKNSIRLTHIVFLLFKVVTANAQKFEKTNKPFTTNNGKTYHVGDTVILCSPADYGNKFHYYYFDKKLTPQRAYYTTEVINKGQKVDNRFSAHIIKQFRVYENGQTIAVTNKTYGYGIGLNGGLATGEVACSDYLDYWADTTRFFLKERAFIGAVKTLGEVNKNTTKEYAYRFDRKNYKVNFQDEFSFQSYLSEAKKDLTDKVSEFDSEKLYVLPVRMEFGSYDFDTNSFPIDWKGNMKALLVDYTEGLIVKDVNSEGIDLMDLNVFLENTSEFTSFPLNPTKAKILVNYRKSSTGKVNRDVYAGVWFKIKELASDEFYTQYNVTDRTKKFLICEVKRIDLFEDDSCLYHYLSTVKK